MTAKRLTILIAACFIGGFAAGAAAMWPRQALRAWWAAMSQPSSDRPSQTTDNAPSSFDPRLGSLPRFTDVTDATGIDFRHVNGVTGRYQYLEMMGAGAVLFDYDGDRDLDLYLVNGNHIDPPQDPAVVNRLYRNDGQWRFTDVTVAAGVGHSGYGQGACAGDYDGDGDLDLYVTNNGPNVLYRNNGDGTFTDVTDAAGVGDKGWGQSCSFVDFDADGDLDLYAQNYLDYAAVVDVQAFIYIGARKVADYPSPMSLPGSADRLFRNNGDGTFTDITEQADILRPGGKGMGLACADFDGDGLPDIFIANDTMENYLFRNLGAGRFVEQGLAAGVAYDRTGSPEASMGVDVADYDHDGDLDLIVPCLARQVFTLYRNDGGRFTDIAAVAGLGQVTARSTGFDVHWLDYDNDGDLDLFFTCGRVRMNESAAEDATYNQRYGEPDLLAANDGSGRFVDVSRHAGPHFQRSLIGRGSAAGDIDNDGDIDLVVSNLHDRVALLRNDTEGGHWVTLDLLDKSGRRNPNGTSIWLEAGGTKRHHIIHPGATYLSHSDRRPHFGLGPSQTIDRLTIRWPDGAEQAVEGLAVNQFHLIRQP